MKTLLWAVTACFFVAFTSCSRKKVEKSKLENLFELNYAELFQDDNNLTGNKFGQAGSFIPHDSAVRKVARGRTFGQQNRNNYGFVIGLDSLKEFIRRIDMVNADTANTDSIHAVRVYLVTSFKQPAKPPGKPIEHLDILLTPVKADGSNYHDLNDPGAPVAEEFPGSLNKTLPCPDDC